MRAFLAALLILFAVPAWAQFNGLPVDGQPYTGTANSSDILSLCQGGKQGIPGTCAPKQAPLSVVLGNYSGPFNLLHGGALGGTFTGTPTWGSGQTFPSLTATGTNASTVGSAITYDYSTGSNTRWVYWNNTLSLSTTTSKTWENDNSFITLQYSGTWGSGGSVLVTESGGSLSCGTVTGGSGYPTGTWNLGFVGGAGSGAVGTVTASGGALSTCNLSNAGSNYTSAPLVAVYAVEATGEINVGHTYFQNNAGTYANEAEASEQSEENFGYINSFIDDLGLFDNESTGITNLAIGHKAGLINGNTTAGSVGTYIGFYMPAMSGGGSSPTGYYYGRNDDPTASFSTLGGVVIGKIATASTSGILSITGPDETSQCVVCVSNSGGQLEFFVQDNNISGFPAGFLDVGTGGSWGRIIFGNTTSGSLQLNAPSSGALSGTLTLPNGTTTIAGLAIAQTFSAAQTFSSTLNLTGLTSDSGQSDATVCDVTGTGAIYYGSGTGGICLTTSTARFKNNIRSTFDEVTSLSSVMHLDTVAWNYKPGHGFDPQKRYQGWTAEQMETVFPELVGHDDDGKPNSVDMMGVLPQAVNAIQAEEYEIIALAFVCLILAGWCAMLQVSAVKMRKRLRAIETRLIGGV